MEPNIKHILLFSVAFSAANSLLAQHALSGYITIVTGSTQALATVRGIQSLAQLLCAIPAGIAADTFRRDRVLLVAAWLGVLAAMGSAAAFEIASLTWIYVAFGMWGAFVALQGTAMEALFADSVPAKRRSGLFTLKFVLASCFSSLGPITVSLLLDKFGSDWSLAEVRPVLVAGAVVALVAMGALFQLNDDDAVENRQRRLLVERQLQSIERNFDAELSDYVVERASLCEDPEADVRRFSMPFNVRTQSELTKLINKTNNYFTNSAADGLAGRHDAEEEEGVTKQDVIPVFCGVDSSQKQRARWNSLEGLTMFSWAGSTVIGATLVATYGYRDCFIVAALLYIIATALDLVLVPITRPAVDRSGLSPCVVYY
ncbi:hypothetical protein ATCC90586_002597 [Pythium insidiosum]|nr:hypothetical protein ATCC90586_002597 [Pythium insidiosum]